MLASLSYHGQASQPDNAGTSVLIRESWYNPFLAQAAGELGLELLSLSPDALVIDGQVFDPARHFSAQRKRDESAMARLRLAAAEGFAAAMAETPAEPGRWQRVADLLNGRGIRTIRGGRWTSENARKIAGRIGLER